MVNSFGPSRCLSFCLVLSVTLSVTLSSSLFLYGDRRFRSQRCSTGRTAVSAPVLEAESDAVSAPRSIRSTWIAVVRSWKSIPASAIAAFFNSEAYRNVPPVSKIFANRKAEEPSRLVGFQLMKEPSVDGFRRGQNPTDSSSR